MVAVEDEENDAGGCDEIWLAAEPAAKVKVGDDLSSAAVLVRRGRDGLFSVGGDVVRGRRVLVVEAPAWVDARVRSLRQLVGVGDAPDASRLGDARALKDNYDVRGDRGRSFVEGVGELDPQVLEHCFWGLPRSTLYYAKEVANLGYGPVARHEKWVVDNKLTQDVAGVAEHEVGFEILEVLVCYDQVDVSNLATVERPLRRLQYVEERRGQRVEAKRLD